MICSYLSHRWDVIPIFKLCIEEGGVSRVLLCSLKMRMMSHKCHKYEQIMLSCPLNVLEYNIHQPEYQTDFPHFPQSHFALKYW